MLLPSSLVRGGYLAPSGSNRIARSCNHRSPPIETGRFPPLVFSSVHVKFVVEPVHKINTVVVEELLNDNVIQQ